MTNYFSEIETEYNRGRGRWSMMSALDVQLADSWEKSGVPLHIVLGAMTETFKTFNATRRPDKINSLRYFKQIVDKKFADWQTSQVGKSNGDTVAEVEEDMPNYTVAEEINLTEQNVKTLDKLAVALGVPDTLPEPLRSAVAHTRGEVIAFTEDVKKFRLSIDTIEQQLNELAEELELSLVISVPESERAELIKTVRAERAGRFSNDEIIQKLLMKKLYEKFDLPRLTMFEI